jgi:hypothetical protein
MTLIIPVLEVVLCYMDRGRNKKCLTSRMMSDFLMSDFFYA